MKQTNRFLTLKSKAIFKRLSLCTCFTVLALTAAPTNSFGTNIANDSEILQSKEIKGNIKDVNGLGLPGVSISVKGTTRGTNSDIDGNFIIEADNGEIIEISFVGFKTQEIVITGQTSINIVLLEDKKFLDDVVVIGYGVQKKSNMTGAVSSVKSEEISKVAVSTAAESLQGRISGVSVKSISGAPGSGVEVKIRGIGSFGGNAPLYIIDGVPGDINFINPEDIASMEVLKDASSAAIYGSRAANGVILISTKNGKKGDVKINFSSYYGLQNVVNTLDLCNSTQWLKVNKMATMNAGKDFSETPWHTPAWTYKNANTDWQDEVYRQAATQNYSINIGGGSENLKYMISGSYLDQEGTVIGTGFNKYNLRAKAVLKKGNLTVTPNVSIQNNSIDKQTLSLTETRKITPIIPVYDKTKQSGYGYIDGVLKYDNPVGKQNLITDKEKNFEAVTSLKLDYKIIDGLNVSLNSSITDYFYQRRTHSPSFKINSQQAVEFPSVSEDNFRKTSYLVEPLVNYNKELKKHNFGVMLGATLLKTKKRSANISVEGKDKDGKKAGFIDENFNTLDAALGGIFAGSGTEVNYTRQSVFGRFNYSYDGKYLFQATVRRDGSSRFGEDNRYGTFPSFSAGWNIHKEDFFSNYTDIVNNLKIRASYGKIGSESNILDYEYAANVYSGYGYPLGGSQNFTGSNGLAVLNNRDLKWEEVTAQNYGVDFSFLNSKITGSVNYYINNRTDMLLNTPIAWSAGINNPKINIGEMENKGFEFELTYQKREGDFNWELTGTFTTVNNKVIKLSDSDNSVWGSKIAFSEAVTKTIAGESISSFYLYQTAGIFQSQDEVNNHYTMVDGKKVILQENAKAGDIRFVDANKDGKLDGDDKTYSGSSIPDFEYSFNINLYYKNFDFTAFFNGVHGNNIYNASRYYTENMKDHNNYSTSTLNAWTPDNKNTSMPRAVFGDPNGNSRASTRFLENGSFLRLKNLQLGYTLPASLSKSLNIDKLRVYASGQNILTFTSYEGNDPEIGTNNEWSKGIDFGGYPISRTFLFGVQLTF